MLSTNSSNQHLPDLVIPALSVSELPIESSTSSARLLSQSNSEISKDWNWLSYSGAPETPTFSSAAASHSDFSLIQRLQQPFLLLPLDYAAVIEFNESYAALSVGYNYFSL